MSAPDRDPFGGAPPALAAAKTRTQPQARRPRSRAPAAAAAHHPLAHMMLNAPLSSASAAPSAAPTPSIPPSARPSARPSAPPPAGDPRLAKFDAATLEHVMRTTNDPNIYAALSNQLNFLRAHAASQPLAPPQLPLQSHTALPSAHHNPLLPHNLLHKQQLYNQPTPLQHPPTIPPPVAPQQPSHHHPFPLAPNPSHDPLAPTLSRKLRALPPHLHPHQFQPSQLQKSNPTSTHSQASHATHSNSTSRRRSPSSTRPPRHTAAPLSDANPVASSTSGARANPNHPLSTTFEDTQSVPSLRHPHHLNAIPLSDPARRSHHFSSTSTHPPITAQPPPQPPPQPPVSFEIDTHAISRECERVLRERDLLERANQKKRRLQQRPWNDYHRVHNPDYMTPFHGLVDAFERIVPFHVLLPPEDASVSPAEWAASTDQLCDKYRRLFARLRAQCDAVHDAGFAPVGEQLAAQLGHSALTIDESILMERVLLDDYYQTVQREAAAAAAARKRAAEQHASTLAQAKRHSELLHAQQQQQQQQQQQPPPPLSVSQPSASDTATSRLTAPHHAPVLAAGGGGHHVGVSNGSVCASQDIVSAGAQAALWRQAAGEEMGGAATVGQRFVGSGGAGGGFVNVGHAAAAAAAAAGGSCVLVGNERSGADAGRKLYSLRQNEKHKGDSGLLGGEGENGSNSVMGRTQAASSGSQVSDGAVNKGSGCSNYGVESSSVGHGGGRGVGVVVGNGDLLLGSGDSAGDACSMDRNGVSRGGSGDGVRGVQDSGAVVQSGDGSVEARSVVGQVGSGGSATAEQGARKARALGFGEEELKGMDGGESRRESESAEANALGMGCLLNSDGG